MPTTRIQPLLRRGRTTVLAAVAALALPVATATIVTAAIVTAAIVTAAIAPASLQAQGSARLTVDHSPFDALLRAHVVDGMVDYDAFARAPEFQEYLKRLAGTDPATLPKQEQLALWINAYNAYTIQLINKHKERKSIRNINKTLGMVSAYGPWKEKLANVGGTSYGLDHIEQEIIRKRFDEPRIHFALVCAAMGCPPLRSEAYTGARLDAQLDEQARLFINRSPSKNRVDVASRTAHLSPIFVEFRDYIKDFGGSHAAVGKYIARFMPPGPVRDVLQSGDFKVVVTHYDWTLNSRENARKATASR